MRSTSRMQVVSILNIQKDHSRFRKIVRGRSKEPRSTSARGAHRRQGKDGSIPVPQIEIPGFALARNRVALVRGWRSWRSGRSGDPQEGQPGEAGQDPGTHSVEVDVHLDELAEILGEELSFRARAARARPAKVHAIAMSAYVLWDRRRCGTLGGRTSKRSYDRSLAERTTLRIRSSSRVGRINAIEVGVLRVCRNRTPLSFT